VGNPKLVTAVYHHFRQLGDKDIGSQWRPDPDEAFTQALSSILQGYQEDILQGITQEQRQYLAALTPLRFYRTQAVAFMLPRRLQQPELILFRKLQDMAEETDVVWWDDSKNGYVTALVLRQVMNLILYLTNREQYIEQHEQAMKLYWQWANKYPENSAIYLTEICFHQAMLDQIAESPVSSLTDMAKIVEFFTDLEIEIDARMILPKKLAIIPTKRATAACQPRLTLRSLLRAVAAALRGLAMYSLASCVASSSLSLALSNSPRPADFLAAASDSPICL
jgi:hypothetical protein